MNGDVHIFEVYIGEVTSWLWLCDAHLAARSKAKAARPPRQLDEPLGFRGRCDDCMRAEQLAASYMMPTVDFVPTSADARLPTREECPPPRAIPPWPKRVSSRVQQKRLEQTEPTQGDQTP